MFGWLNHLFLADRESAALPRLIWVVVISTLVTFSIGGIPVAGFSLSGWAWVVSLAMAVSVLAVRSNRVTFPVWIVVPLAILLTVNWLGSDFPSLQRSLQLLSPVIVGIASSSFRISEAQLRKFAWLLRVASLIALVIVVITTGIVVTGSLPDVSALAPHVMTAALLCCYFAAHYAESRDSRMLILWGLIALMPIIGVTRTGVVVVFLTLPLTLGSLGLASRLLSIGLMGTALLITLFTERFQTKMFTSGEGTLADLFEGNYETSGRDFMWDVFKSAIEEDPWLARGTGAGEDLSWLITNYQSGYPHNDWLLLAYDWGVHGATLFMIIIGGIAIHAYLRGRKAQSPQVRILLFAGASAFVPYALFMYTDNISVYSSFFGNLHFAILGLGYAAFRTEKSNKEVFSRYHHPYSQAKILDASLNH